MIVIIIMTIVIVIINVIVVIIALQYSGRRCHPAPDLVLFELNVHTQHFRRC